MKNVNFHLISFRLGLVGLLFAALAIFGSGDVNAQTSTTAPNFVAPHTAIQRIQLELNDLKNQLEILTPNTSSYNAAFWKYEMYSAIMSVLEQGFSTGDSYTKGVAILMTDPFEAMPSSQKKANKIAAYELLIQ